MKPDQEILNWAAEEVVLKVISYSHSKQRAQVSIIFPQSKIARTRHLRREGQKWLDRMGRCVMVGSD